MILVLWDSISVGLVILYIAVLRYEHQSPTSRGPCWIMFNNIPRDIDVLCE